MLSQDSRRLSAFIGKRDNHIDQLRLLAAIAVVIGHSWHISLGPDAQVPFEHLTLFGFHELAVHVFFFLSGLLVTESARRFATRPLSYVFRRVKRIFPALIAHAILIPILLVVTGAWTGLSLIGGLEYAARLMTLFSVQYSDPNAFAGLPFEGAINGSVWSLRHEIIVYALLCAAGLFGAFHTPWRRAVFLSGVLALILTGHALAPTADSGIGFMIAEGRWVMFSFLLGVLAHQFSARIPLRLGLLLPGLITLGGVQVFALPELVAQLAMIYTVCAVTLLAAYHAPKAQGLKHDISYGIYIYSWPLQQLSVFVFLKHFGITLSPLTLIAACAGPILIAAWLSWILVERPALSWRGEALTARLIKRTWLRDLKALMTV